MGGFKLCIICLFALFLTLGVSFAEDCNNSNVLTSNQGNGFDELQNLIDESHDYSVIDLTEDYLSDNDDFPDGIVIDKPLTINGNNHIIDANFNSRIFLISSSDVVLNDIVFINGKTDFEGGAIKSDNGVRINNCTFINNHASMEQSDSYGGAIYQNGGEVYNSCFVNNSANLGGAIYQYGESMINKSYFSNNFAVIGGAIYQWDWCSVYDSYFTNNSVDFYGGAISQYDDSKACNSIFLKNSAETGGALGQMHSNVYNSIFIGNSAIYEGGAISQCDGSNVSDSHFVNNSAEHGGAIYNDYELYDDDGNKWDYKDSHIYNCTFENNHAKYGCDNYCNPSKHSSQNQSDNVSSNDYPEDVSSDKMYKAQNGIAEIEGKNNTGNPLLLLILSLFVLITRIKK